MNWLFLKHLRTFGGANNVVVNDSAGTGATDLATVGGGAQPENVIANESDVGDAAALALRDQEIALRDASASQQHLIDFLLS